MSHALVQDTEVSLGARAIAETVFAIERGLDLAQSDWHHGDLHLWPIYRMELYRRLFLAQSGAPQTPIQRPWHQILARDQMREPDNCRASAAPLWLISDGVSFANMGGREVERFCSPIAQACEQIGVVCQQIDRGSPHARNGRAAEFNWWAPMFLRAKLRAWAGAHVVPDRRHDRLVKQVQQAADDESILLPVLSPRRFDAMCRAVDAMAIRLERRLHTERVRAVFVVCYYDVAGYAFIVAAARAGVPSVDVQHGVAGELHPAYAQWQKVPPGGYRMLPRWFWTWTESDALCIEQWARSTEGAHRALIGGHPFLEAWRNGAYGANSEMSDRLAAMLTRAGDRPRVLVTLQPGLIDGEAVSPLLDAIAARPDIAWWLRLHPAALADRASVEARWRGITQTPIEIDAPTALPLPLLLAQAHWHATHSSSAVIEAHALGVPSVIWSAYGAEFFAQEIIDGHAHAELDGTTFARRLHATKSAVRHSSSPTRDRIGIALRQILELQT